MAGAMLAAVIALLAGAVLDRILPHEAGQSTNLLHSYSLVAPCVAGACGALVAPLALKHPGRGYLAMASSTFVIGVLVWPLAAIFLPMWTGELSCFAIDSSCKSASGMPADEIIREGVAMLGQWYDPVSIAVAFGIEGVLTGIPVLVGAAVWVFALRRIQRI